jgi:hypothetical protein
MEYLVSEYRATYPQEQGGRAVYSFCRVVARCQESTDAADIADWFDRRDMGDGYLYEVENKAQELDGGIIPGRVAEV